MAEVHVISENDLQHVRRAGTRIRACCPIHNSRDRDLSIAPYSEYLDEEDEKLAGFGFCHSANCGVTVLVKEWNPRAAANILRQPVQTSAPRITLSLQDREQAEDWQRRELAALNKIADSSVRLLSRARPAEYLAARGLAGTSLDIAGLGIGYIPPLESLKRKPPAELYKWCDRLIFPFTCADGTRGFIGRALALWQPGMDENEHKHLLDEHNERMEAEYGPEAAKRQVRRWVKTYRSGFFNAAALTSDHAYLTEGPFDALALLLAGLPGVIAVAGTHIDVKAIPASVMDVTLAFDSDMQGKEAIAKTIDLLGGAGITPKLCTPPVDGRGKDWNERYRLHGIDGLAAILAAEKARQDSNDSATYNAHVETTLPAAPDDQDAPLCSICGVSAYSSPDEEHDGSGYCFVCWLWIQNGRPAPSRVRAAAPDDQDTPAELLDVSEHSETLPAEVLDLAGRALFSYRCQQIAEVFGGGTVRELPPGFTLADRVAELKAEKLITAHPGRSREVGIPNWLIPGTKEWDKQVVRNGLEEMTERRAAWFDQKTARATT